MDALSPFIPVLCHSDWLFHGESCPRLDVVHPGRAWPSTPACTWHCLLLQATRRILSFLALSSRFSADYEVITALPADWQTDGGLKRLADVNVSSVDMAFADDVTAAAMSTTTTTVFTHATLYGPRWASAHRGKWGQLTPWKNGWKI